MFHAIRKIKMDRGVTYWHWAKILTVVIGITFVFSVTASELQDVKMLLREGKLTEALIKAEKALEKQHADAAMRFTKGLILSEQKKTREAIDVFSKLITDFPDYPEPYNNLAVLFATDGQYVKARIALETALKINPEYATAHENLGDVFLQSAIQSYDNAIKNDGGNKISISKLRAVKKALGLPPNEGAVNSMQSDSNPQLKNGRDSVAPERLAVNVQNPLQEREIILKLVEQWARAWSAKDTKAYFSLYSHNFKTPQGETVKQWKSQRRARINNKDQIDVQIFSPSVTIAGNFATVNFQQSYSSGKLSLNERKTLTFIKYDDIWKISKEQIDR